MLPHMRFDELMALVQKELGAHGTPLAGPAGDERLVRATLQALRNQLAARGAGPVDVPGLGVFRPRPAPMEAAAGQAAALRWLFEPEPPDKAEKAWRQALRKVERPLLHPQRRFVVLFSAKSACSSVVIWFLHTLGLAAEARAFSEWPHHYRINRFYAREDYLAARDALGPDDVTVLRVVRDPVDRAGSSFRHALGLSYARETIREKLGIDTDVQGLSFERFIDFLEMEDLDHCDPHHKRQKHAVEGLRRPDVVINASRQDLFTELNAFERMMGMPVTNFKELAWVHELQATRVPHSVNPEADVYRTVLTREQAQNGPWPKKLITPEARARLEKLYAEDMALYAQGH
jgi:Sulfotransferase family